jgi:hypothetical protein
VAGVLRKAGREELPDLVEDALRVPVATGVTGAPLYTAKDAGDLPALAWVPGLPPFVRSSRAGAGGRRSHPGADRLRRQPVIGVDEYRVATDEAVDGCGSTTPTCSPSRRPSQPSCAPPGTTAR